MNRYAAVTVPSPSIARRANAQAAAITGRPYVSWSQIAAMRTCPQRFAFRYVHHAREDFVPSSLRFGSCIHSALEARMHGLLEGLELGLSEMHQAYRLAWSEERSEDVPIRFNQGEDETLLDDLAGRMLRAFLDSPLSKPAGRIIAVEETIQLPLADDLPDILARVDLVCQEEDGLRVADFKTSRSRWSQDKANQSAEQLLPYRHMMAGIQEAQCIHLSFAVLTKAKSPVVQMLDVPVQQPQQVLDTIRRVWSAVEAGNFYPSPGAMNCACCAFKSRCPAF